MSVPSILGNDLNAVSNFFRVFVGNANELIKGLAERFKADKANEDQKNLAKVVKRARNELGISPPPRPTGVAARMVKDHPRHLLAEQIRSFRTMASNFLYLRFKQAFWIWLDERRGICAQILARLWQAEDF